MRILVTGAAGFLGKNLCAALRNIKENKDLTRPGLTVDEVFEYDIDSAEKELEAYCAAADFVFNLAGVNRPKDEAEFMAGNFGFAGRLLDCLKKNKNAAPVMLSSSIQATLEGRYGEGGYGKSKLAVEELFFKYAKETGARVLVYRFPNIFGKWCKPNYNSVVATFCNNIANDLDITVNDPSQRLELVYVDDVVEQMLAALEGAELRCEYDGLRPVKKAGGRYCCVPAAHNVTLGEIVELLRAFHKQPESLIIPDIPSGSFAKKLYTTYLSYLPREKISFPLKMNTDERGSFTELLKTISCGQFSVNISNPGITKGQHWHHSKWEIFIVVSGCGLIKQRRIGSGEVLSFEVSGKSPRAVYMLPGYTHNIINLSEKEPLITIMWANEQFDPGRPDTFFEPVEPIV